MNDFQYIQTDLDERGIYRITINRPDKLNALNKRVIEELHGAINLARDDEAIKAVLLTGHGKAFCAGADISEIMELDAIQGYEFARWGQMVFRNLEHLGKPSLAAVNGYAFGGGCELTIACSMRIASDKAAFAQPEVKLGVIPGYGGTQRLARLIGKGRAIDLCLTGRIISAEQALQYGLVSEVVAHENMLDKAYSILNNILDMGPMALTAILEVIDRGYDMPLEDAIAFEAMHFGRLCASHDKVEGTKAFLEKRKANFNGN